MAVHTEMGQTESVALVTGGSGGFGHAVARNLVLAGWRVYVDGRDADELERRSHDIGALGVAGDVADPSHRAELFARVMAEQGRLDLLVNNAGSLGAAPLPPLRCYPVAELAALFDVNVLAPLALAQLFMPALARAKGAVLNVTSDAAVEAYAGWGGYGATKAALEQLGRVMAVEEPAVRFWALDPGDMRTRMHQDAFVGEDISDRPLPEVPAPAVLELWKRALPSGRYRASSLLSSPAPSQPAEAHDLEAVR